MPTGKYLRTKEMYLTRRGRPPWNKGLSKDTDERVRKNVEATSKTLKRLHREGKLTGMKDEKNPAWKGNKAKYGAIHLWVRKRKKKPKFCEKCKKRKPHDLANISGKYKRDVDDFEWLCRSCHMKKDGNINNFKKK